jgi:hypothetical protein
MELRLTTHCLAVNNLVQIGEARPPLERDVSMSELLVLFDVALKRK